MKSKCGGNIFVTGNISGSSTSTGSFSRVEVEQVNIGVLVITTIL